MKVDQLKEKARRFEQKEDWAKALDLYREALNSFDEDEPPDITLYNRVGDIQTRLGQIDGAVEQYERAIELYLEAELPNNAIAICKKVLRNLPDRNIFFLRMGQIRASQGFLTDARHNFLTYAENVTEAGDIDAAMDALLEFVDLSPEDVEIRLGLASQLESQEMTGGAVEQYSEAYRRLVLMDRDDEAEAARAKVEELKPDAMLPDPQSIRAGAAAPAEEEPALAAGGFGDFALGDSEKEPGEEASVEEMAAEFGEIDIGGGEEEEEEEEEPAASESLEYAVEDALAELETEGEAEEEELDPGLKVGGEIEVGEEIEVAGGEDEAGEEEDEADEAEEAEEDDDMGLPTFDFDDDVEVEVGGIGDVQGGEFDLGEEDEDEKAEPLPTFGFDDDEEEEPAEEEGEPLPGLEEDEVSLAEDEPSDAIQTAIEEAAAEEAVDVEGPAGEAPVGEQALEDAFADEAVAPEPPAEAAPPTDHRAAADAGDLDRAIELVRELIEEEPDRVEHYQRLVEYAFRTSDQSILIPAYMDLAGCLARTGSEMKAKAVYQQILSLSPGHEGAEAGIAELEGTAVSKPTSQVASSEEYVDLGSMILGEEEEKTTRWKVAADAPSGDDQADFAKMLGQFKEKVAENFDADDVGAHHDLGTAYMEMGLLDEAISEFQMALRAAPGHLPTHEVMGRCWMEMGNPDMAVRALGRALETDYEIEDELIGIYYLMGRAKEELGNQDEAVEFYEKVFSLDINFEDVTERLRSLR